MNIIKRTKRKKRLRGFLSAAVSAVLIVSAVPSAFADGGERGYGFEGEGTKTSPYLIGSVEELELFRDLVNGGESFDYTYFLQTADIDLTDVGNWTPIGQFDSDNYFYGVYDGGGHTISNLTCISEDNVGLFGLLCGEVCNLGIESGYVEGLCVGGITSHGGYHSVIFNCYNKAEVHGTLRAGGLADYFNGTILFSLNLGKVTSDTGEVGGILSYDCAGVEYCYSIGIEPINENFHGTLNRSLRIGENAIDSEFLERRAAYMRGASSMLVDTDGACELAYVKGVLRFVKVEDAVGGEIAGEQRLVEAHALAAVLAAVLIALIAADFFVNVRKKKR